MVDVRVIETPSLGDRSYLVTDGGAALVIDPQRDIGRVLDLAASLGAQITHVAETHIHNDYLTGGLAVARATGARYLVNADDPVRFARTPVRDGGEITVTDRVRVRVLATPGHTFTHLSYLLLADGAPVAVFTGGSLLYGSTGRPDLLGASHTGALARAQYASAQRLARELPDDVVIYPTHGFGSFCSAWQSGQRESTIGREKAANPALALTETGYVESLLAGLDAWPTYYAHMMPGNLAGPAAADLSPPRAVDPAELRSRVAAGEWVVDVRGHHEFARGHLPGTVGFALGSGFASYLGWLAPWGAPLTLLGATGEEIAEAQLELARIGYGPPAAAATGSPEEWAGGGPLAALPLATFADLAAALGAAGPRPVSGPGATGPGPDGPSVRVEATGAPRARPARPVVLDVRRRLEWEAAHIAGAIHIPFHELPARLADVPPGDVWAHCQSGYRATVAASLLAARNRRAISVVDDFGDAAPAGLPMEKADGRA